MPTVSDVSAPWYPTSLLPVLSAEAMRAADQLTIERFGLPAAQLMETAGRATAEAIEAQFGPLRGRRVVCLCGSGNNGGDGLVIARVLLARGAHVHVVCFGSMDRMSDATSRNYELLEQLADADAELTLMHVEELDALDALSGADVYVDAMLGAGLTTPPRSPIDGAVAWLNRQPALVVAVDVPTGIHSDTGEVLEKAVRADLTVTMGALKAGLVVGTGTHRAGRTEVADIGIPHHLLEEASQEHPAGCAHYLTDAAVAGWLPERPPDAHKYTAGLVVVIAGSPGMTGAPLLSSQAAARAGAGFVTCATHAELQETLAQHFVETTTVGLPGTPDDGLDAEGSLDALKDRLEKARALVVGPGLGNKQGTRQFVRSLLDRLDVPVVIDADALNALADEPEFLEEKGSEQWVLTPHMGEFKRLAGDDADVSNLIETARTHARRWGTVLVLKGQPTLVASPDGRVLVNSTGNAALATAGTGDVLAGMTAGLLAQGARPDEAAACAVHIGGACAEYYSERHGLRSMIASDIIRVLPDVLRERYY